MADGQADVRQYRDGSHGDRLSFETPSVFLTLGRPPKSIDSPPNRKLGSVGPIHGFATAIFAKTFRRSQ